jgi:hypothetical protein
VSFTCPKCWRTSYHPEDERFEFCGFCHEFTGDQAFYGHERHSGSSVETQPDGPMQLQQGQARANVEVSQVQRDGKNYGMRFLRRERMGREEQQRVHPMQGDWMLVTPEYVKPSMFRFYLGAVSVGFGCGIAWTAGVIKWVKWPYNYEALYGVVAVALVLQAVYLYHENKRLKKFQAELDQHWEQMIEKYPELKDAPGVRPPWKKA